MPPEVLAAGEDNILAALDRHPPDAVVLTPAVIAAGHFTLDDRDPYGAETLKWIMKHYQPIDPADAVMLGHVMSSTPQFDADAKRKLVVMVRRSRF